MGRKRNDVSQADVDAAADVADNHANGNGTAEPKPVESKADKFRKLANRRLLKAEKVLAQIRNLANRSAYEYTDEQREIVLKVVISAANRVVEAFNPKPASAVVEGAYV